MPRFKPITANLDYFVCRETSLIWIYVNLIAIFKLLFYDSSKTFYFLQLLFLLLFSEKFCMRELSNNICSIQNYRIFFGRNWKKIYIFGWFHIKWTTESGIFTPTVWTTFSKMEISISVKIWISELFIIFINLITQHKTVSYVKLSNLAIGKNIF
jgi:hypothetical protein